MSRIAGAIFVFFALAGVAPVPAFPAENSLLQNGGFEQGFEAPWGVGQYGRNGIWWNAGGCQSAAGIDFTASHSGRASLHISNPTGNAPNVYGTTVQAVTIQTGQKYRITLWAKGKNLASKGAISLIADKAWHIRPILLPPGTFEWQEFSGTFELPSSVADIRIISQDKGEAWIDDISIAPATDNAAAPAMKINAMAYGPAPALRGSDSRITVEYDAASDMPVPVVEEWTLMFDDKPVMSPFRQAFEIRKNHNRHEITLPVPTEAAPGRYRMKLHATSSAGDANGQILIDIKE